MSNSNPKKDQQGTDTHKTQPNAGSGAFNQGAEADPDFDKGTEVSDEEKRTGHLPTPGIPETAKEQKPGGAKSS